MSTVTRITTRRTNCGNCGEVFKQVIDIDGDGIKRSGWCEPCLIEHEARGSFWLDD